MARLVREAVRRMRQQEEVSPEELLSSPPKRLDLVEVPYTL
jgi:hypothetical protein